MFTGIVQGTAQVESVDLKPALTTFVVRFPKGMTDGLHIGASVALNGACMTATHIDGPRVRFDAMGETLLKTTFGTVVEGERVNFERSAKMGDEIGGHVMSGHIIGTAEVVRVDRPENNHVLTFRVPASWMKYVFEKGFMGIHGTSLTLVNVDKFANTFEVHLIPETLQLTNLGDLEVADSVNIELDSRTQAIVDTVEQVLKEHHV